MKVLLRANMGVPGWVYLIRYGSQHIYKIGCTKGKPKKRLMSLQCGTPTELRLTHQIECENAGLSEYFLQKLYGFSHVRGEWFYIEEEQVKSFCEIDFLEEEVVVTCINDWIKTMPEFLAGDLLRVDD